jgi:acetyl-CoA carboxylase carboxyl transferase subunit alpha
MSEEQAGNANPVPNEAWSKVEQARHPQRPSPMEFVAGIFRDFSEIHDDRAFGDDEAVACGMARLDTEEVMGVPAQR